MSSPQARRELLVRLYGFDFPEDLHRFFAACRQEKPLDRMKGRAE